MPDIRSIYEQQFLPSRDDSWLATYRDAVEWATSTDESAFRSPAFQRALWEIGGVSTIGPGNSVVVTGAYEDSEIIDLLWSLRNWAAPSDPLARAQYLDREFERILGLVSPRHNARRPSARLVRIFTTLRVYDVHCLMDGNRTGQFREWVGASGKGLGLIGQNVIARQAVRDALGPERSLEDAVSYNQFAWFVWDRFIKETDNEETGTIVAPPAAPTIATDTPKLVLLPARMQRKGMFYTAGNLRLLMSLVRAAENGIETEDLVQQIIEEAPNLNQASRRNVLAQAVSLNLLAVERGTYCPTTAGRRLLEGDAATDVLTPIFVRNIFGFGLILRDLFETHPCLTRGEIAKKVQGYYPNWTSEFGSNALVAWLRDLKLVSVEGTGRAAKVSLTEDGEYWGSGLPENLETLAAESPDEQPLSEVSELTNLTSAEFVPAPIEAILSRFENDPDLSRFVFSDIQVRLVHAALHSTQGKRFILLAGLSGTGKTSMARVYAQGYCEAKGVPPSTHYAQIAVWPDWTDPSGLLGFVNPLADPPSFHETPALRLLLEADRNPSKPYFLCLDEMNLARVEHYFAPFLSAMEGNVGRLAIHSGENAVAGIPPSIAWPRNLFILGTVNMDETTHPFSDKVLDRAFTFEFWDVDLDIWRNKVSGDGIAEVLDSVFRVLKSLNDALAPARRHFGYRTCDEVLGFCAGQSGVPLVEALDAAVLSKVLPKVRGDSGGLLPNALTAAAAVCHAEGLTRSEAKLTQMQKSLAALGFVRFWS